MRQLPDGFMEWLEKQWLDAMVNMRPEDVCSELGMSLDDALAEFDKTKEAKQ